MALGGLAYWSALRRGRAQAYAGLPGRTRVPGPSSYRVADRPCGGRECGEPRPAARLFDAGRNPGFCPRFLQRRRAPGARTRCGWESCGYGPSQDRSPRWSRLSAAIRRRGCTIRCATPCRAFTPSDIMRSRTSTATAPASAMSRRGCANWWRLARMSRHAPALGRVIVLGSLLLLLILAAAWTAWWWYNQQLWEGYLERLRAQPGIVITEADKRDGKFVVSGLRDPLAADPLALLGEAGIDPARVVAHFESLSGARSAIGAETARGIARSAAERDPGDRGQPHRGARLGAAPVDRPRARRRADAAGRGTQLRPRRGTQ